MAIDGAALIYYIQYVAIATRLRTWQQICEDPALRDLPYRIETDGLGKLIMSPTRIQHGEWQFKIGKLLEQCSASGIVITECAVRTSDGVKVADLAWYCRERHEQVRNDYDAQIAGQICAEIMSPANRLEEMHDKRDLFFEAGAEEVWLCDLEGKITFFSNESSLSVSKLAPNFPSSISA